MIGTARHIPIEAVREAAAALSAMRGGAMRTPLVQVDLPDGSADTAGFRAVP